MSFSGAQHPDGDPFANESRPTSLLDRLEAQAREEHPELSAEMGGRDTGADTSMRSAQSRQQDDSSLTSDSNTDDEDNESDGQAQADNNEEDDSEDDDESQAGSVNLDQDRAEHAQTIDSKTDGPQEPNTEGQTNAEAGNKEDVSTAGPGDEDQQKKKRKRKQRSPSPPRPPPPKPQPTIRLDVPIPVLAPKGGLMLNIRQLAKDADQLVDNPEPHLHDDEPLSNDEEENNENTNPASAQTAKDAPQAISESTADVLGRSVGALLPRPKKRKRRRVLDRDEGYDKEDPFVDDSELHLDLVKTCGVPECEGFYVHSGELPLLQKGKRKRTTQSATPAQAAQPNPQQQPQQTSTSNAASPGAHGASGSPAPPPASSSNKPPDQLKPLDPHIEKLIEEYKPLVAKESFVPKNKFPEALKEPLFKMALEAVKTGDYEESFFPTLTTVLPYNKFTLTKLVKRNILPRRLELMGEVQEKALANLQTQVNTRMNSLQKQYDVDCTEYRKAHDAWRAANPELAAAPPPQGQEGQLKEGEPAEPAKKFKLDDQMKQWLFEILTLESEMVRLQAEKVELEKGTEKVMTDQTARKKIYARLAGFWPEGWMTTTLLSREWSQIKKKFGV